MLFRILSAVFLGFAAFCIADQHVPATHTNALAAAILTATGVLAGFYAIKSR